MTRQEIEKRTGGVIKFRKGGEFFIRHGAKCAFCGEEKAVEQIVITRGTKGRRKVDIAWQWIGPVCGARIREGRAK